MRAWWVLGLGLGFVGCSADGDGGGVAGAGGSAAGGGLGGGAAVGGSGGVSGSGAGPGIDAAPSDGQAGGGNCPDGGVPGDPGCECGSLKFSIDTKQSCAIDIAPGFAVDGEGFIQLSGQNQRVFAMDRWGKGHVIGWCDSTTLPELLAAFDVRGYLGQTDQAKVASFGDTFLCQSNVHPLPSWIQFQGTDLPAKYKGNAALLAQEWDVLIFCGFRVPWSTDWSQEISEFVGVYGKGFLASMEYEGSSTVTVTDYQNMNKITQPAGILFQPLNLPWAPSSTSVDIECVPDLPPPPT